ncbi:MULTISPECIES: YhcN/YlaJ family sporulation lipoprotein [unclassified Virgibacillus]|uniref:YhcN/YlaJ family sporulation lipoprotein n=1 Tax=unclassified Virgibacillus TaxID=2620237 RepID=UPI0024DE52A3|nr:YhcN/YlaJ family sporulation lipoprotein [Virgibacillus sp. LDC-1]
MLKLQSMIWMTLVITVLVACDGDTSVKKTKENDSEAAPIHYETEQEQQERLGSHQSDKHERDAYPQQEEKSLNGGDRTGSYTDKYTTEDGVRVADHLMNMKEVKVAQVAITKDKVIVAVRLAEGVDPTIQKNIEREVSKFISDKPIVIYTDDNHWDRIRNMNSRFK